RDQQSESVAAFRKLVADKQHSPLHLAVLADSYPEMLKLQTKLQVLDSVDKVLSINSLIPIEQTGRLRKLQGLSSNLPNTNLSNLATAIPASQGTTLSELQQALTGINATKQPVLYQQLSLLIARLKELPQDRSERVLRQLDTAIMGNFSASLQILRQNLNVEKITLESLPRLQRRQWLSPLTERYLLLIYPATAISDEKDLRKFVGQVQEIAPRVTDTPAISLAAGDVAVSAFKQALLTALVLISLLLWIIYKDLKKTILILTPLLLAALFTVALSAVLGIPFNFSNLIAIPLLLGIGVDNGIHMISRDHINNKQQHILHTSTTRAVILSAFTTIVSFGNLGFSSHPGTASMGQLLTLGVSITLLCTLFVLPLLLTKPTK
ncbi:MAG: MMPL family transporter, partial [Thiohalomonadales bacterium]